MIAGLSGEIVDIRPPFIVLTVGGVSYLIAVTNPDAYAVKKSVSLYTHLAVRENALDLYGFDTREDLLMFEQLIKLPKIGPKTALQILSQADIPILKKAAGMNDPIYLSKMSGIGKKSAEKIVVGLKNLFEGTDFLQEESPVNQQHLDVVDALIALGYSQRDALDTLQKIPLEIIETNAQITYALKLLGTR